MSKVQFMRFFKKVTGQTFHTYLQRLRVARAQALLSTSDKSIADISTMLGFCSQSHFGRTFTTLVGLTPLAYRCRFGKGTPTTTITDSRTASYAIMDGV